MTPFPWLIVVDLVGPRVATPPPERRHGRAAWGYWALGTLQSHDVCAARVWQMHKPQRPQAKGKKAASRPTVGSYPFRCAKRERPPKGAFWQPRGERTPYAFFSASSCLRICASTAAMAVMLSTRREVALVVRICTGLATPIRIGPIATPSVNTRTRL